MQNRKRQPVPAALFLFSDPAPLRKYPSAFGRLEKLDELRGRRFGGSSFCRGNAGIAVNGVFRFDGDHIRKLGIADLPGGPGRPGGGGGGGGPGRGRGGAAAG